MAIDPKVFKQVRKTLGLTQAELADELGLSRITINKMERGKLTRGIPDYVGEMLMKLKRSRDKPDAKVRKFIAGRKLSIDEEEESMVDPEEWDRKPDARLWGDEDDD